MSLYKRGDVWHYDFTVDGERYRGSTQQSAKAAAARVEARERERAKLGTVHPVVPTLAEAADKWFAARAAGRRSGLTTAHRLKIALRHIEGGLLVTEIGTPQIEAAVQSRRMDETHNRRAPTNGTVNRDMIDSTLRPVLNYCGDVLELPMRRIAWAKVRLAEPKGRNRAFTPTELAAWRRALPSWHRPVFDFLALYGVRLREAFFEPGALDVAAGEVRITNRKNGSDLILPLLPEDVADLAARATRAKAAKLPTLWYRDVGGELQPIHWRGFQSASKAALKAASISDARPAHDLRHHAATAIRRAGDVTVAQMLLGHDDIRSTARYAHASREDVLTALRHAKDTQAVSEPKSSTNTEAVTGT
jgi:integrase